MLNFCLLTPKRHILAQNRVVWGITRENQFRYLGCSSLEEPKKTPSKLSFWCANSRIRGKETHGGIANKFRMSVRCPWRNQLLTFCDDRLRGLGVAMGRISRFPIDLRRRPYNTLALPCECVMLADSILHLAAGYKGTVCCCRINVSRINVCIKPNDVDVYNSIFCQFSHHRHCRHCRPRMSTEE